MGIWKGNDTFLLYLLALLFSATFRKKIEKLARDILIDPIRVVQGDIGEVTLSRAGWDPNRLLVILWRHGINFSLLRGKKCYCISRDKATCFRFVLKNTRGQRKQYWQNVDNY